ncbi:MAG TPA: TolC family protein [Nannocystaceae bacterium]|nr:TolC family protein [Nannocystaceae bacterium]
MSGPRSRTTARACPGISSSDTRQSTARTLRSTDHKTQGRPLDRSAYAEYGHPVRSALSRLVACAALVPALVQAAPPSGPAAAPPDDFDDDASGPPPPRVGAGAATSDASSDLGFASAFDLPLADRRDPYGPRPSGIAKLSLDQIARYSLGNPAVRAADEHVNAMKARLKKAKFAWVPIIDTVSTLTPGANVKCEDVVLQTTTPGTTQDFQFCHPPDNLDIQSAGGYFRQLGRAGVRFQFQLDTVIPLYTFGKIKNVKKIAEAGVLVTKLQKAATQAETLMRVQQAYSTLLLARESIAILREAKKIVDDARKRVAKDLGGGGDDFDADPSELNADRDPDDLVKVNLAALELEENMREALKVESLALSALWALAGKGAPVGFDIDAKELDAIELDGGLRPLRHYKELAVDTRPEAKMASAGVQLRKAQERLARSNFLPDLGIAVSIGVARSNAADKDMRTLYYQDGFNFSRVTAALALRWRFDFHNDAFDLIAARADLRAAEHQQEAAQLLLGRDVEEAYADLVDARTTIEIRDRARRESWKIVVSQQQRDTVGGGNSTELLRALEKWYKWRFAHVEAIGQHNVAAARLARAVGAPLWAPSPSDAKR